MALSLDLTKDEYWYCKLLAKGQVEFSELDFDKKLLVYEANVNITDTVSQEEIEEFEEKLALKGYFGTTELAKQAAKTTKEKLV